VVRCGVLCWSVDWPNFPFVRRPHRGLVVWWCVGVLCAVCCVLLLLGASEASEQSERAKLSGAFSGFPLLTHAFAGVALAFSCFLLLRFSTCFLPFSFERYPGIPSLTLLLFLTVPCLLLVSLISPCAEISQRRSRFPFTC
jgi:ABC-type Fe3+ transport system permease subunit